MYETYAILFDGEVYASGFTTEDEAGSASSASGWTCTAGSR